MNEHRFEHCRVVINVTARWLSTTFSDGAELIAAPNMDAESVARARSLGYLGSGDHAVWAMTRDHELLHTLIAEAQGHPWSPTLHAVAHGYSLAPGMVEQEERVVLFAQRLRNVGLEPILGSSRPLR